MKCRICGAKLKKESGDICTSCYKAYQEEEDLKKDTNITLKLKRKYSIPFEITKYTELFVIGILSAIGCLACKNFLGALLVVVIFAVVFGLLLFLDKLIAKGTKAVFYEKKVVYKFKFLFIKNSKTVKYSDLKDIAYFQTFRQKKYGYADICVYAKGAIPGATLLNGFQIKNVENAAEVLEEIRGIVGEL